MHTLSTLFPAVFPALALSHFVALLSPGPDFFCWSATPCATGSAAASDCVSASPQAMRCILCSPSSAGASAPGAAAFAHRAAGGGLFIVDWQPADTQPSRDAGDGERSRSASGVRQAAAARAGVIAAQPQKRPVLSGADDFLLGAAVTLLQQTVSGLWMVSVVFFWDLLLVSAIALPQIQRRLGAIVWRVERAAGAILMLFGLGIIWRFLHDLAVRLYA